MKSLLPATTGIPNLDEILDNLYSGDNVVWQVDKIDEYKEFVIPFVEQALAEKKKVIYMRFAKHEPLIKNDSPVTTYNIDAYSGFESFSKKIYTIITETGEEAYYVFDCLTDLLPAWSTDMMIGNFFVITCPYLYELNTVAYFAIYRNQHNFKTIARIRETTQLLIDVYYYHNNYCIHPLKVQNRYSPTMFFPHIREKNRFIPINNSNEATRFIKYIQEISSESTMRNLDYWDRIFIKALDLINIPDAQIERKQMIKKLCSMIIGREKQILELAGNNFTLEDFAIIKDRLIGSGYIGGKAAGMLLARKILQNSPDFDNDSLLEPHDSFYIGSDVFYSYIVQNGWWKLFMEQRTRDGYFTAAKELKLKMLTGTFRDEIKELFQQTIEYFGQSPFIVRSSSLLEDAYGNAFAGKYESYFCVNQGSPQERYREFTKAIRNVYASTMNEDALAYRLQRGLDQMDEQMALLVQRVSGTQNNDYFFPDVAGVGFSHNSYVWKKGMDPHAGMLRLVFGLGTRAVDRIEGDYPRIVALDDPMIQPLSGMEDLRRFSQHEVDLLDIKENRIKTISLSDLISACPELNLDPIAIKDSETANRIKELGLAERTPWLLNFEKLLSKMPFASDMHKIMKIIENSYLYPVDIEFTVNFTSDNDYRINLLQCRPYQVTGIYNQTEIPENIPEEKILFKTTGHFLGGSILQAISRIIYVDPVKYGYLTLTEKHDIARLIGTLNRQINDSAETPAILLGPGRWGTTTPSLGVPVSFSEIHNIKILVEIAQIRENVMPELSYGTHFFLDLVETEIFYVALFPEISGVSLNLSTLDNYNNIIEDLVPDNEKYKDVLKVYNISNTSLLMIADILSQKLVCYFTE